MVLFKVGAVLVYTPEVGITLDALRQDVEFLKLRYRLDMKGKAEGRLVIRFVIMHFLQSNLTPKFDGERLGTAIFCERRQDDLQLASKSYNEAG